MLTLYLFALGVGGVLLAMTFFADADGPDDFGDSHWQQLFSLRNVTYFLFVFGAVGSALSWMENARPGMRTLVLSTVVATIVASIVHATFAYIHRTDSSEVADDTALVGQSARVTLAVGNAGVGKIELTYGGQRVELLARPFNAERDGPEEIGNGSEVVIVEMVAGTALVSRTSTE